MEDQRFLQYFELLRVGRFSAESEPVGDLGVTLGRDSAHPIVGFSVWLDHAEVALAAVESGEAPEHIGLGLTGNDRAQLHASMIGRLLKLKQRLPEHLREWLTYACAWDEFIRSLDFAQFRRLLETQENRLPSLLGVPAVQERVRQIREKGSHEQRTALANIIAGRRDGRPARVPKSQVLYHLVLQAEEKLRPIVDEIAGAQNAASIRRRLQRLYPAVMSEIADAGLADTWFAPNAATGNGRSQRRKGLSAYAAAVALVAGQRKLSPLTVEKRVGSVRNSRTRKRPAQTACD
jgi:hypothetical protein